MDHVVATTLPTVHALDANADAHDEPIWHDELPKSNATNEFQPLFDVPRPLSTIIAVKLIISQQKSVQGIQILHTDDAAARLRSPNRRRGSLNDAKPINESDALDGLPSVRPKPDDANAIPYVLS